MPQDYNQTLNLPKTDFPMRAGLPQREPVMLSQWEKNKLYYKMIENNRGKPLFVFHDGPPYANAAIHLGTALNKVLKDIIVRYKNMSGYMAAYIPGWDTHGLPIELKAIKQEGFQITSDPVELRKHCKNFALHHVEAQKGQFKRLGTLADYDNPYLTLQPKYEATQVDIFGQMAKKGYIYKDLKSVHWCPECVTALAEAELEYAQDECDSIYVKFQIKEDNDAGVLARMGAKNLDKTYILIWTTTTWTLPANLATCLGPDFEYALVQAGDESYLLAKDLVEEVMGAAGIQDYAIVSTVTGKELEFVKYRHPFLDRTGVVILGDHVTLESGTGCVHTAPGHGVEDFDVCVKYGIDVIVPVDDHGKMTAEAGEFVKGLPTAKANPVILEHIKESGHLLAVKHIVHQYPHCWRCKDAVLFRATEQWFCSVEDFKEETMKAIEDVQFIPEWGRDRMISMVEGRKAWCISRQRIWGVPIPVFYCDDCGDPIINDESIAAVSALFRAEGADAWFIKEAGEILPAGFACPKCGGKTFTKEKDIMDVWFDSGVSHTSVLDNWPDQIWPCDLYLEGTDQYRGWFQSALLTAVASKGKAPYKTVVTHGWTVDGEGRKMSKSLGNGVEPLDIINEYGADVLRLWVASSDFHQDTRISKDIMSQMSEVYRKLRNTARYILGNLNDFNPDTDSVPEEQLTALDKWALARHEQLLAKVHKAYSDYDFHIVYHAVHNFCTIDMSNFYLDIIKDRLYVENADSAARRAAQTAMHRILRGLTLAISPVIPFTAEEIWGFIPESKQYNADSVTFNEIPRSCGEPDEAFMAKWDRIIAVRGDVNKALETSREAKIIGKSLEAKVRLYCDGELHAFLEAELPELAMLFIVSQVELSKGTGGVLVEVEGLGVEIVRADGEKCERCWCYSTDVGLSSAHPTLCRRCGEVVG